MGNSCFNKMEKSCIGTISLVDWSLGPFCLAKYFRNHFQSVPEQFHLGIATIEISNNKIQYKFGFQMSYKIPRVILVSIKARTAGIAALSRGLSTQSEAK